MENIFIRSIIPQDYKELSCLHYFKYYADVIRGDKELQENCLVALERANGLAVGFILGEPSRLGSCILWSGEVKKDYQKRGIFSLLLKKMEAKCEGRSIILFNHSELNSFYQKRGYEQGENLHVHLLASAAKQEQK